MSLSKQGRARLLRLLREGKPVWEVTGTWSGYKSSQERLCHRHYTTDPIQVDILSDVYGIRFTDNTLLYIKVKKITDKKEINPEVGGYDTLIHDCLKYNIWTVADLPKDRG